MRRDAESIAQALAMAWPKIKHGPECSHWPGVSAVAEVISQEMNRLDQRRKAERIAQLRKTHEQRLAFMKAHSQDVSGEVSGAAEGGKS